MTAMPQIPGALPCPFCGCAVIIAGKYACVCSNCGATGPDHDRAQEKVEAWNERAPAKAARDRGPK